MHFDTTVNLGNVVVALSFVFMGIVAWRDLTWRIKNLEAWRLEHMIDSESREKLLEKLDRIVTFIERETLSRTKRTLEEWRQK